MKKTSGNTIPAQGERQERVPRTPNERDESADSQERREPSQKHIGGLAHDAAESEQQDTDKGPVLDATYHELRKQ